MSDQVHAWEQWYRCNPTNWKGSPLDLPELPRGSTVLDVGCGTGNTILQALEKGYEVTGIDLSQNGLSRAKKRLEDRGYEATLVHGNILDTLLGSEMFDCVLLHHVMDNLLMDERRRLAERSQDLLVPEGLVSFQDLSSDDVRFMKGSEVEPNTFQKGDGIRLHFFDINEVRDLFHSFTELSLEKYEWSHGMGASRIKKSRIVGIFQLPSF